MENGSPDEPPMPDRSVIDGDALSVALDQAWHSIDQQETSLDAFRSRIATFLGAITIGSGIVGAVGQRDAGGSINHEFASLALVAFAVQFLASLIVLYPWTFSFSRRPDWLSGKVLDAKWSHDRLAEKLLRDAGTDFVHNRTNLRRIGRIYNLAQIAFALAVGFSILALLIGE